MAKRDIHVDYDFNSNQLKNFRLEHLSADPEPLDGSMYYNTELKTIRVCTDGKWSNVSNSPWFLENDTIVTDLPVHIKNNLYLDEDEGSMGEGEDNTVGLDYVSLQNYLDEHRYVTEDNIAGLVPEVDLSKYYTKDETIAITYGLSSRIDVIETLIGEDKSTIEGAIDTFYEIEHFLSNIGNTTLENIISQLAPKTTKISAGTGLTGGGDLSADRTLSLAKVGTAGTYAKVVVDAYGRVTGSASLGTGDIPILAISKINGLQDALDNKVGIAGDQTITGAKTFSALATFNKGMVITGDVTINGNLFLTGDEASMGDGGSGTGGGMNETELENYLKDNDYLFGSINGGREANVYAPTSGGTSGQVLVSRGSTSTPEWKDVADLGISGSAFEGGALSDNIWFTRGDLGVVTSISKLNVIRGQDDEVMVGSGSIPTLLLRASTAISTVLGINTAMRQRDGHTDLFTKTIIDPGATYHYGRPFTGFTDQDDWSMFIKGDVGLYMGGINIYTGVATPYFRVSAVGNLLNVFAYDSPTATTSYNVLTLSGYGFSMLYRGLQLRLSNDSQKSNALRFYDETDGTQQFLGIDASKNLIYNSNVVLHSGNYTDYISGGGADLSDYYTKTESDARYLKSTGGSINGNLSVRGNLSVFDNPLWLYNGTAQWLIQPSLDNGLRISSSDKGQMFIDYNGNLTLEGGATFGSNVDIGNKYILNSNTLTGISFVSPFTSEGCLTVIQDGAQPQFSLANANNEVYFKWGGYQLLIGQRTPLAANATIALAPSTGQIQLGSSSFIGIPAISLQCSLGTTSINMYNGQLACNSMVILHEGNYTDYISGGNGADLSNYFTKDESDARYMTLGGGVLPSNLTSMEIISAVANTGITFSMLSNGNTIGALLLNGISARLYSGTSNYISISPAGIATVNGNTILHSGNYNSYISGGTGVGISESDIENYDLRGETLYYSVENMEYLVENGVKNGTHIIINTTSADLTYFKHIVPRAWMDNQYMNIIPSCEVIIQLMNKTLTIPVAATSGIVIVNPSTGALTTSGSTVRGYHSLRLVWIESQWFAHILV